MPELPEPERTRCALCRAPTRFDYEVDFDYGVDPCELCERVTRVYRRSSRDAGDADYAFHELAHAVVLFRRVPRYAKDWRAISDVIDTYPIGVAQAHEMRVLALQYAAYKELGWRPSLRRLVELSWPGLKDPQPTHGWRAPRGAPVVESETAARSFTARLVPKVSPRNKALFLQTVRAWRS